jgi:hypothetical protein
MLAVVMGEKHGEMINAYRFAQLQVKWCLEDQRADGKIILKWVYIDRC